ncbi:aspartate aminotransferase family protein [Polyangium aurulentum]|uniref:aspartate aminotransferase family protein n=1 Tax=Polyangium aurulentum TaxID=2567896 RepID=UPI00146F5342|nr:aminotransferase class III-fold pyridoxal phosphate-dependent enzyme [Polyangium aurulentum]UQA59775.1 aminotransferase class III-fold pyridoxal phosphate-dependent enzyme [Polyangium aurulentum]
MSSVPSSHPAVLRYAEHMNPAFVKLLGAFGYGRVFVGARQNRLWDHEGREYLDFLAGFGANNLGHNHPRLRERMRELLLDDVPNLVHAGPQVHAADLAFELTRRTGPLTMCLFSCTGAEAVETGLKLARAATRRPGLLHCSAGYHGLNLGNLSVNDTTRMRAPFEPLLPACQAVPFGDLDALERALADKKAAAFLVEPIQAEGGVIMPPAGYLASAQELCRKKGTVLVLDEVQTGLGRTGTLFAHEREGFFPDVLVLGKALGGGMVPISATLTTRDLHERAFGTVERFDLHGSTYAGNAFACRTAMEVLRILDDEKLIAASEARGGLLLTQLRARLAGHPLVREVRGRGLFVGLELGPTDTGILNRALPGLVDAVSRRVFGQWLAMRLLEKGILAQPASQQWNVLKLEPPLTVTDEEIDRAVTAIAAILGEYRELGPLVRDVAERLGKQFMGGWRFG